MKQKEYLGIDVGASGIKGAIVDVEKGVLISERFRIPTPQPSWPKEVSIAFNEVVSHFGWEGKTIGCGFPSVIKKGIAQTAANINKSWMGTNIAETFSEQCGCPVIVRNDADVAGIAEMQFGVGNNVKGTVLIITIGSGLGSALFRDGLLVPNTELGHLFLKGHNEIVEHYAADSARKRLELSWEDWAMRFNKFLEHIELIIAPDLIILGGGGSKKFDKFEKFLTVETQVLPAVLLNNAGIIGAAVHAYNRESSVSSASKMLR
jgi:polyphosphate glucokinase